MLSLRINVGGFNFNSLEFSENHPHHIYHIINAWTLISFQVSIYPKWKDLLA